MGLFGISFPWETVEGEGFIAPWTPKVETPGGWAQASKAGPGDNFMDADLFGELLPGGGLETVTPLPAGPTASAQEQLQAVAQAGGSGGVPDSPNIIERLLQQIGNIGQPEAGPQPGDDLVARTAATRRASGITPDMATAGIVPAAAAGGGISGLIGAGVTALGGLALSRLKMPWETAPGEGIIAPWSRMEETAEGWIQSGGQVAATLGGPGATPLSSMTYGQLKGGVPVKAWTNAAKNGRSGPTVAFVLFSNGMMASQSLIDGSIKTWRPKKHIVISNNPRLSTIRKLSRVKKRVDKMVKKYTK